MQRLMIAGSRSGVGKTTVTLGVLQGLSEAGALVQPLKVGPDYLDISLHAALTGRPCYNLDGYLMPGELLPETFRRAVSGSPGAGERRRQTAAIAVVEGMMGLYDGVGTGDDGASSAAIARRLGLPVVLVIDVFAMAGSAGALAMGYRDYDHDVIVAGAVLNRVAGEHHARACEASLAKVGIPVVGAVPANSALRMRERHLGLVPAWERQGAAQELRATASQVASHLDVDAIAQIAAAAPANPVLTEPPEAGVERRGRTVRIGVARDPAFNFYYQDTLDTLVACGAELVTFSPLADEALPADLAGLYLGGGFPEEHLDALESNVPLRDMIRARSNDGMPIYAECGGLMYLCRSIRAADGQPRAMCGVLPGAVRMGARQAVAYVDVEVVRNTPLLPSGARLRGHVFHNSVVDVDEGAAGDFAYALEPGPGIVGRKDGWVYKNVLASYSHLPLAAHPRWVSGWLDSCRAYRGVHSGDEASSLE